MSVSEHFNVGKLGCGVTSYFFAYDRPGYLFLMPSFNQTKYRFLCMLKLVLSHRQIPNKSYLILNGLLHVRSGLYAVAH